MEGRECPIPPPPLIPCVDQDVNGELTTQDITVSVYNSGHTRGLAGSVSKQLTNVGFVIDSVSNRQPSVKKVTIIGQDAKNPEVGLVAGYFPGAVVKSDPKRVDHEVEVVLSDRDPNFKTTAPKSVKVNGSVCLPSPHRLHPYSRRRGTALLGLTGTLAQRLLSQQSAPAGRASVPNDRPD